MADWLDWVCSFERALKVALNVLPLDLLDCINGPIQAAVVVLSGDALHRELIV